MSETGVVAAFSTAPNVDVGRHLARRLVDQGLAACVNLVPGLRSVYRWKGKVEEEGEVLLVIKTEPGRVDDIARALQQHHPYDVPELIAWPITAGARPYLDWVRQSVHPESDVSAKDPD